MSEEYKKIAEFITDNIIFCTKEVLTSDEAAKYCGFSKSYLYKLTMRQQIHITKAQQVNFVISIVPNWNSGYKLTEFQLLEN